LGSQSASLRAGLPLRLDEWAHKSRMKPYKEKCKVLQPLAVTQAGNWLTEWGETKLHMSQPCALAAKKDNSTTGRIIRSMSRRFWEEFFPLFSPCLVLPPQPQHEKDVHQLEQVQPRTTTTITHALRRGWGSSACSAWRRATSSP